MSPLEPEIAMEVASSAPAWLPERLRAFVAARPVVAKLLHNASWLMAERVATLAVGFFVTAWFIRYLGPTEYGRLSYAVAFSALFGAFTGLGMDTILVRDLARNPDREGEILGTALVIRVLAGTVGAIVASIAVWPLREDAATRVLVVIVSLSIIFAAGNTFDLWFQARIAARGVVITRTAVTLVTHALRCAFIVLGAPVLVFGVLYSATGVLMSASLYGLFRRRREPSVRLQWSRERARTMLRDAIPMVLVSIAIAVYMKIDQVMLVSIAGDRENGIYAPAATLSELWYFIPVAISSSAFPVIVKSLGTLPPREFERRLQMFYDGMVAVGYAIALPIGLMAGPLVSLLFGPQFARTANVLQVHVISLVFATVGIARARYLIANNMLGFTVFAAYFGAALNVGLNFLLLPRHGALGAAWATVIAYAGSNYFSGLFLRPMWGQTAMLTRALLLPIRLITTRGKLW